MICALWLKSATDTRGQETVNTVVNGSNATCIAMTCVDFSPGSGTVVSLPGVVVHRVKGHATGLHGPRPGARDVPSNIKSASLDRFFPPWTVRRQIWADALKPFQLMLSSSVRYTSLWFTTTRCSGGGCPITPGCRCLFCRCRPWLVCPAFSGSGQLGLYGERSLL